jgi:putative ABC transport system permease protein
MLGAQAIEGLLLALPAALVGYVLANLLVDGRASNLSLSLTAGIVIATAGLLVLASAPLTRRNLQALDRAEVVVAKSSPRRIVLELAVVVLAVCGVYLLRRRGIAGDSAASDQTGFDIYLAAVPVLLGLAVGLLVLRVYPLPIRALAWAASLRRDLVPVLGFKRVARQPAITAVPLLVLLLAVAVGIFSSVMLHTIDVGQVRTSWQTIGADYRVDSFQGTPLYSGIDLSVVEPVDTMAEAFLQPDTSLVASEPIFGRVTLLAVQPSALATVTDGTPADANFPSALLDEQESSDIGTPQNPIPAIVSRRWVSSRDIENGDTFTLSLGRIEPTFVVREIRATFPTLPLDQAFVVTSLDALRAMNPERPLRHNRLYVKAPDSAYNELASTLDEQSNGARLLARGREYAAVHDAPLVAGTIRGFRIGLGVAAVYSALAIVVALTLTERARARDLSFLRTLGLSNEQAVGLVAFELGPPVALAIAVGIALGIASARLIEPGLDLMAFTGPEVPVALLVDLRATALLALGLVAVVVCAVVAVGWATRRANLAGALRLGDE